MTKSALLAILTAIAPLTAGAAQLEDPVGAELRPFVYTLSRPIFMYNWFSTTQHDSNLASLRSATDPIALEYFRSESRRYFNSLCSDHGPDNPPDCPASRGQEFGLDSAWGPGLYLAVDPESTAIYSTGHNWEVIQVRLPQNLRVFDVGINGKHVLSSASKARLTELGCPASIRTAQDLFKARVKDYPGRCLVGIRGILKDQLKVEAIVYSYPAQVLAECFFPSSGRKAGFGGELHQSALILINSDSLKTDDVRIINNSTLDAVADRALIASFFYKMMAELFDRTRANPELSATYPGAEFYDGKPICETSNGHADCVSGLNVCRRDVCQEIPTPTHYPLAYDSTLKMIPPLDPGFWPDLDGKNVVTDLHQLIEDHFFGCGTSSVYREL